MEQGSDRPAELICQFGRLLYEKNLIAGNQGNLSLRLPNGSIKITPSGRHKGLLEPRDIITITPAGKILDGVGEPSTDTRLHIGIYARRPDVMAVCHAHPIYTTISFSGDIESLDMISQRSGIANVPVLDEADMGAEEFIEEVQAAVSGNDLFVLYNHGVFACGNDLEDCLIKIENLERDCRKSLIVLGLVGPEILDDQEDAEFFDEQAEADSTIEFPLEPTAGGKKTDQDENPDR